MELKGMEILRFRIYFRDNPGDQNLGGRGEGCPSNFGREHRGVNRGAIRHGVIRTPAGWTSDGPPF